MRGIRLAFRSRFPFPFLLVLAFVLAGCALTLQRASTPEEARLSAPPLKELSDALRARVDKGEIPGAVVLVARATGRSPGLRRLAFKTARPTAHGT